MIRVVYKGSQGLLIKACRGLLKGNIPFFSEVECAVFNFRASDLRFRL